MYISAPEYFINRNFEDDTMVDVRAGIGLLQIQHHLSTVDPIRRDLEASKRGYSSHFNMGKLGSKSTGRRVLKLEYVFCFWNRNRMWVLAFHKECLMSTNTLGRP